MGSSMNLINFSDAEFPEKVYKYRHFQNPSHLKMISERQVYFAAPKEFDDPYDCKNFIRYDLLTIDQLYRWYYHTSLSAKPNMSHVERISSASKMAKTSDFKNPKHIKKIHKKDWEEFNERFGIFSVSANSTNTDLWKEYSDSHKGFAIGFDPKIAFNYFGGGGKVVYDEKLPELLPRPYQSYEEQWMKQVFYKLEQYSFEEEYRIQKIFFTPPTDDERAISLPKEAFSELILGANISENNRSLIVDLAKKLLPHIDIFQARILSENKVVLEKL